MASDDDGVFLQMSKSQARFILAFLGKLADTECDEVFADLKEQLGYKECTANPIDLATSPYGQSISAIYMVDRKYRWNG